MDQARQQMNLVCALIRVGGLVVSLRFVGVGGGEAGLASVWSDKTTLSMA